MRVKYTGRVYKRIYRYMGSVRRPEAFEFRDNVIVVTIPFDRLDLGSDDQDNVLVNVQDDVQDEIDSDQIEQKIIKYCTVARSTQEITDALKIKGRKTVSRYIRKLLDKGKLAMTLPEKPNSRYQKYISIK